MNSLYDKIQDSLFDMFNSTKHSINGGQVLVSKTQHDILVRDLKRVYVGQNYRTLFKQLSSIPTMYGNFDVVVQEDWLPDDKFSIVLNLI